MLSSVQYSPYNLQYGSDFPLRSSEMLSSVQYSSYNLQYGSDFPLWSSEMLSSVQYSSYNLQYGSDFPLWSSEMLSSVQYSPYNLQYGSDFPLRSSAMSALFRSRAPTMWIRITPWNTTQTSRQLQPIAAFHVTAFNFSEPTRSTLAFVALRNHRNSDTQTEVLSPIWDQQRSTSSAQMLVPGVSSRSSGCIQALTTMTNTFIEGNISKRNNTASTIIIVYVYLEVYHALTIIHYDLRVFDFCT